MSKEPNIGNSAAGGVASSAGVEEEYGDIIGLPHYEPQHHRRMAPEQRAAQFAPFAAVPGHDSAIRDAAEHHAGRQGRQ